MYEFRMSLGDAFIIFRLNSHPRVRKLSRERYDEEEMS